MKKQQLYDLIGDPSGVNESTLTGLQDLVVQYPFFQAARLLLLKNLQVLDNVLYEPELKRSAMFISDRTRLFDLIRGVYPEKQMPAEQKTEDVAVLEEQDKKEEKASSVAVTGKVESVNEYFGVDDVTETLQGGKVGFTFSPGSDGDRHGVPEEFMFDYEKSDGGYSLSMYDEEPEQETGSHSFEDWLSLVNNNMADENESADSKTPDKKNKTIDVIDRFLSNRDKKIKPRTDKADTASRKIEEPSSFDVDELMTETLAKIYIKQGHYFKALNIFEKLSLKYPEKSVYFAQQIENVKKLSSNQ